MFYDYSCVELCSVALPYVVMGWSALCGCVALYILIILTYIFHLDQGPTVCQGYRQMKTVARHQEMCHVCEGKC